MPHDNIPGTIQSITGERGAPGVGDLSSSDAGKKTGRVFLIIVLLLTVVFVYFRYTHSTKTEVEELKKDIQMTSAVPKRDFEKDKIPEPLVANNTATLAFDNNGIHQADIDSLLSLVDKSNSGLMISKEKDSSPPSQSIATSTTVNSQSNNGLGVMLAATHTPAQSASLLENRHYLLAKSSFIECVLQTRLDTTVPGMTSCVVARNIYSDDGKVLLVERGSTVSGEYQSNMHQGQNRIFVLWTRLKTPSGIIISLDSPGADSLGGSGLPGYVDNHFWERFGGALMLSLVQDAASAGANAIGNHAGQNTINVSNTSGATQHMATEALKNTINIPPTLYKNQGERIGIYVARDLNFANVYDLKLK